jgi:hypothetical protein
VVMVEFEIELLLMFYMLVKPPGGYVVVRSEIYSG